MVNPEELKKSLTINYIEKESTLPDIEAYYKTGVIKARFQHNIREINESSMQKFSQTYKGKTKMTFQNKEEKQLFNQ